MKKINLAITGCMGRMGIIVKSSNLQNMIKFFKLVSQKLKNLENLITESKKFNKKKLII